MIVEGLKLLIGRIDKQYAGGEDRQTYQATMQFLHHVHSKYSNIASTPLKIDEKGNIILRLNNLDEVLKTSAIEYLKQSVN